MKTSNIKTDVNSHGAQIQVLANKIHGNEWKQNAMHQYMYTILCNTLMCVIALKACLKEVK